MVSKILSYVGCPKNTYCPCEKQGGICSSTSWIIQLTREHKRRKQIFIQLPQVSFSENISLKNHSYRESKNGDREAALLVVMRNNGWNLTTDYFKCWVRFTCIEKKNYTTEKSEAYNRIKSLRLKQPTIINRPSPWKKGMIGRFIPLQIPVPRSNPWSVVSSV